MSIHPAFEASSWLPFILYHLIHQYSLFIYKTLFLLSYYLIVYAIVLLLIVLLVWLSIIIVCFLFGCPWLYFSLTYLLPLFYVGIYVVSFKLCSSSRLCGLVRSCSFCLLRSHIIFKFYSFSLYGLWVAILLLKTINYRLEEEINVNVFKNLMKTGNLCETLTSLRRRAISVSI